jgi:hypothetical protein
MNYTRPPTEKDCVRTRDIILLNKYKSYVVKRTSGELESGWVLGYNNCMGRCEAYDWMTSLSNDTFAVKKMGEGWRILLNNNSRVAFELVGGWRRLDTMFPTALEGNEAAIQAWRDDVVADLEHLEKMRLLNLVW